MSLAVTGVLGCEGLPHCGILAFSITLIYRVPCVLYISTTMILQLMTLSIFLDTAITPASGIREHCVISDLRYILRTSYGVEVTWAGHPTLEHGQTSTDAYCSEKPPRSPIDFKQNPNNLGMNKVYCNPGPLVKYLGRLCLSHLPCAYSYTHYGSHFARLFWVTLYIDIDSEQA